MTLVAEKEGIITQVIGPVIDVEFESGILPEINNAIEIIVDDSHKIVAEVQQHLGENRIRSVAMSSTDGIKRGMKVINTEEPIKIPVGKNILGRILNVLGKPVDNAGAVEADTYLPIHRTSPTLVEQNTDIEILETGIKAIDLLQPYQKGGKKVMISVKDFDNVDTVLNFVSSFIKKNKNEMNKNHWTLDYYWAAVAHSTGASLELDVLPKLETLLRIKQKNEIICFGDFSLRYTLKEKSLFYSLKLKGTYLIDGGSELYYLVKKD